ncbi:MAG TPA: hypothetical protein ENG26_01495 [Gammaproteobacteria bacterium]|nr:hypothetical protein [Gammaproteobacteria bacterium]
MKVASKKHQHGAVTLVGALFLIMAITILLGAVQRMAATDITDTALHNDAVEALFIAESGLERAGWRYATGSSCAALAGETDNIGRGSFQINSAALVGTLCLVQVTGNVVTTIAANAVNRTIEGYYSRGSFTGWAVGDASGTAILLGWDGSSWSSVSAPAVPVENLQSVYCITADYCWAVGAPNGTSANINHWDGSTWSNVSTPAVPGVTLYSVHCVTTDDCWAVGQKNGNAENLNHWNGSSWSNVSAPAVPGVTLYSVHCVATDDCWAVGQKNGNKENLNHWNGSSWSNITASPVPNKDLHSVYCVAGNDCWAVGQKNGNAENLNHWNGSSWSNITAPAVPNKDLNSIVCIASNDCSTVGAMSSGENIDHWNGSAWSRAGPYASISNSNLNGAAMVNATEGYTVGDSGTIAAWDGSNWAGQTSPVSSNLNSVSVIGGAGGGGVALVQWTEVIQ